MKKRILSLFLTIVMLMGMMPTAGLAQPEAEHFSVTNLAGAELSDGDYVYSGDELTVRVIGGEEPYTSRIQIEDDTGAPIVTDPTGSLTYAVSADATRIVILCQYTAEHETASASYTLYVKKPTLTVTRNGEELAEADAIYAGDTLVASCGLPNATFRWYFLGEGNTETTLGTDAVLNVTQDMLAYEYIYINVLDANGSFIDGFALIPVKAYTVTLADTEHGAVAFAEGYTSPAAPNEWFLLDITPDEGYVLNTVTVTGDSGEEVFFDYNGYGFRMPEENVTVSTAFIAREDLSVTVTNQDGEALSDGDTVNVGDTLTVSVTGLSGNWIDYFVDGDISLYGTTTYTVPQGETLTIYIYDNPQDYGATNTANAAKAIQLTIAQDDSEHPSAPITVTVTNQNGETLSDGDTVNVGDELTVSVTGTVDQWIDYFRDGAPNSCGTAYTVPQCETLTIYIYDNADDYLSSVIANAVKVIQLTVAGGDAPAVDYSSLIFKVYKNGTEVQGTPVVANGDVLTLQVLDENGEAFTGALDIDWFTDEDNSTLLADDVYTYTIDTSSLPSDMLYVAAYTPAGHCLFSMNFSAVAYTVTLEDAEHGAVAFADGYSSLAAPDSWVYLTFTPDEGYELDTVTITGDSGADVGFYSDNSFLMPYEDVNVTVTFRPADPIVPAGTLTVTRNGSEIAGGSFVYAGDELVASFDEPNVIFEWYFLEEDNTKTTLANEAALTVTDEMLAYEYIYINVYAASGAFIDGFALIPTEAYTITLEEPENGSVAFAEGYSSPAQPDSWVYLNITPDEGCVLDTVTVTGDSGANVYFYTSDNSFLMPHEDVTVQVVFGPKTHYIGWKLQAADSHGNAINARVSASLDDKVIHNEYEDWSYDFMEVGQHSLVFDRVPDGYQTPADATLTISDDGVVTTEADHVQVVTEDGEHVVIVVTLTQAEPVRVETKLQLKAVDANGNPIGEMLQGFVENFSLDTDTPTDGMWYVDEEYTLSFTSGNVPTDYKTPADVTFTVNADGSVTSSDVTVTQEGDVYFLMIVLEGGSPTPTYAVTIAPTTGGTVTADKAAASEGETVTLTVTPDAGFELESLAFALEGAASAADITDTRTFTMPAGNVIVTAVFKQTAPTTHLYNLQLKALGENDEVLSGSLGAYVGSIVVASSSPNTVELPVGNSAIEFFDNGNVGYKFPANAALNVSADGQLTVAQGTHVSIEQDGDVSYIVVRLESSLHPITVNVNGSGRVKVEWYGNEFTEAEEGKQLTVLITPDGGHAFASLVVNGENVTDRVIDAGASVKYDFTMPDEAVTVTVTFISITFDLQLKLVDEESNEISIYATGYVDGNSIIDNSVHSSRILEPGSHTLVFASIPQGYVRPEDAVLNVDSNGNLTSGSSHATVEKVNDVWFIIVRLETKQPTSYQYKLQLKALGENDEVLSGSLGAYVGSIVVDSSSPNTVELPVGNIPIEFQINHNGGYKFPAEAALNVSADGQLTVAQGSHISIEQDGDVYYIVVRLESSLHPITVNVIGSGRVKVHWFGNELTEAEEGKQLTVQISPDNGHAFASLIVNGENVTDRVIDAGANVLYDFTMPDEAVTVTVTFISITFDLKLKLVDEENNEISINATGHVDGNAIVDNRVSGSHTLELGSHTLVFDTVPDGYARPEDAVLNVDSNGNLTSGSSHATVEKVNDVWFIIVRLETKQPTSYQYKLQLKALGENDEVLSEPFAAYVYAASVDSSSPNTVELPVGNIPIEFQINHNGGYKFPANAALNVSADGQLTVAQGSHISIEQDGDVYYIVVRLESSLHPITVNVNGGGSVTASWAGNAITEAEEGRPIKLDIIPDEGYAFASLVINGTDVTNEAVELINGEFTYEFTMPDDDVTIVVSFRENPSYEFSMRLKLVDEENNTIDVSAHGLVGNGLVYTYQDAPRTLLVGSNTFKLFYVPDGYLRPEDAVLNVDANGNLTSGSSHVAIQKDGDVYCIVVTLEKEAVFSVSLSDDLGNEDISAMDVGRTYTIHAEGIPDGYIAAFYVADQAEGFFHSLSHSSPFTFTQEIYDEYTELLAGAGFTFDCFYAIVWDGTDVNTVEWWEILPINAPASTYTVTVTTDGNGTASASPASGETGTEVTLTATPSAGYQFKEWQVISGGVTVANNKFTIGTANVEIKAIFEPSVPTHSADITVIGQTGASYTAVQAKLMPLGSTTAIHEKPLSAVPGSAPQQFLYHETAPDGSYNLVITATDEETGKTVTVTTLIDLQGHDDQHTAYLPSADRSSIVNDESGSGIIAGNTELIANAQRPVEPDGHLEVQLSVDDGYDDQTGVSDKFLIEQKAGEDEKTIEKVLDIDLTLLQYDKDNDLISEADLGDTNTQLIEIMIPVDTTGRRADGFAVYRVHNGVLQKLPHQGEWFEVNIADGYITLHVKHFSSYAIAYGDSVPVPSLPQTGDESNLYLWLAMCVLSMAGILLMRRKPLSK